MEFIDIIESYDFIPQRDKIIESINKPKDVYFRVNVLKDEEDRILEALSRYNIDFTKVDFVKGYYKLNPKNDFQIIELSKTPEHLFGFLYIQELSSAISIDSLYKTISSDMVKFYENGNNQELVILDLCASPGGKSILLIDRFYRENKESLKNIIFILNDIGSRMKNLLANISRMGILNAIVTNCDARFFPKLNKDINLVIADVPCSSESHVIDKMFYSPSKHPYFIHRITKIQKDILKRAIYLTKKYVLYSTCTFNLQENEQIVNDIIANEKNINLLKPILDSNTLYEKGIIQYKEFTFNKQLENSIRIYPYHYNSGGIFFTIMEKEAKHNGIDQDYIRSIASFINLEELSEILLIDNKFIYENYLSIFGIPFESVKDHIYFQKVKNQRKINLGGIELLKDDIYVTLVKKFLRKDKGPLKVESFGIKAFRFFKPLNQFKITSNFLSILSKYITKNYLSLKFDLSLLIDFLCRKKIEKNSENFEDIRIDNNAYPYVAIKFNKLTIGCALNYKDYIISEIPSTKANFFLSTIKPMNQ